MQRPTTASKPSPPPAESDERRLLREIAQLNYRTGMALVRNAKETLRRLDEADSMKPDQRKGK
jgi:hypothetical protein